MQTSYFLLLTVATALISGSMLCSALIKQNLPSTNYLRLRDEKKKIFRLHASSSLSNLEFIDSWTLMADGRIKGLSSAGENVITSQLKNPNGLKETATIETVSGSRYLLGKPDNKLSVDQLGILRGVDGKADRGTRKVNVKATLPLMKNYVANNIRATMHLSTMPPLSGYANKKKNDYLTPLVGGASAVLIGAAVGSGVIVEKGVSLDAINNGINFDPKELLKSSKELKLPDIKSLQQPNIPSLPLPQKVNLPKLSAKPPYVYLPTVSVPEVLKGVIRRFDTLQMTTETKIVDSVGQGPYRVPMPYMDQQLIEAEESRAARAVEAEKLKVAEIEATKVKEQEALVLEMRQREQAALKRAEDQAQLLSEQEDRAFYAEQEASRFRDEIEQIELRNLENNDRAKFAEEETARLRNEIEQIRKSAEAKEKFTVQETAELRAQAEDTRVKELRAKEGLNRKLEEVKQAEFQGRDLDVAAEDLLLQREPKEKTRLADEVASREVMIIQEVEEIEDEVRRSSVGAMSARKSSYTDSSLSSYGGWQERQRERYRKRIEEGLPVKKQSSAQQISFLARSYKDWQQLLSVPKSDGATTAAAVTGAVAPLTNRFVSGVTLPSDAFVVSENTYFYITAGGSIVAGGLGYIWQQNDEHQGSTDQNGSDDTSNDLEQISTSPPLPQQPLASSVSAASQPKTNGSSSVTRQIPRRPQAPIIDNNPGTATPIESVGSASSVELQSTNGSTTSYLESMTDASESATAAAVQSAQASERKSYSPFGRKW